MVTNLQLNSDLVESGLQLTKLDDEAALINLALEELVRSRQKKSLLDLAGKVQFYDGYDHKALRNTQIVIDGHFSLG